MSDAVREAIYTRFENAMSLAHPTVKVRYENQPFTQPLTTWVSVEIHEIDAKRASIGTEKRFQRHMCILAAVVYLPENSGLKIGSDPIDTIITTFEESVVIPAGPNHISFKVAKTVKTGLQNGWYPVVITIPFQWDTCKSP